MGTITIVGLGPGAVGHLSLETMGLLKGGARVILRTAVHPTVEELRRQKVQFTSCDDLYEQAASFEDVYNGVVQRVLEERRVGEPVDVAVVDEVRPGAVHPLAQRPDHLALALPRRAGAPLQRAERRDDRRPDAARLLLPRFLPRAGLRPLRQARHPHPFGLVKPSADFHFPFQSLRHNDPPPFHGPDGFGGACAASGGGEAVQRLRTEMVN